MRAVGAVAVLGLSSCALFTDLGGLSSGAAAPNDGGTDAEAPAPVDASGPTVTGDATAPDGGHYADCRSLHAQEPAAGSGVYEIDPDGAGPRPPLRVYCDMTFESGGWTLVGRSAGNIEKPFGWKQTTGSVDDDGAPYSMGAATADLSFTELLLATHEGTKLPSGHAYKIEVPPRFVTEYENASYAVESTPTVLGSCAPAARIEMLRSVGFTSLGDAFWFRDAAVQAGVSYGLMANGWSLYYDSCDEGGLLTARQGMLFVR